MNQNKDITPSMEDYLESILKLEIINIQAKIKDIAVDLDVQMPSVIGALKTLRGKGLVLYEKNSSLELTDKGKIIAVSVKDRHEKIAIFLQDILLFPEKEAQATACRIEHVINPETAKQLSNLTNYLKSDVIDKIMSLNQWREIIIGN